LEYPKLLPAEHQYSLWSDALWSCALLLSILQGLSLVLTVSNDVLTVLTDPPSLSPSLSTLIHQQELRACRPVLILA
jgi:hypothetical protein